MRKHFDWLGDFYELRSDFAKTDFELGLTIRTFFSRTRWSVWSTGSLGNRPAWQKPLWDYWDRTKLTCRVWFRDVSWCAARGNLSWRRPCCTARTCTAWPHRPLSSVWRWQDCWGQSPVTSSWLKWGFFQAMKPCLDPWLVVVFAAVDPA